MAGENIGRSLRFLRSPIARATRVMGDGWGAAPRNTPRFQGVDRHEQLWTNPAAPSPSPATHGSSPPNACAVLAISNPPQALARLDGNEKGVIITQGARGKWPLSANQASTASSSAARTLSHA
jgi:hypothetical protein